MAQNTAENVQTSENAGIDRCPTIQQLRAVDPHLFVRMPGLEELVRREQQFSELFGSLEDAQHAVTKAADLDRIEATLVNGDLSLVLHELSKKSPESLPLLVDNLLPTLQGLAPNLVGRLATPVVERLVDGLFSEGERTGDADLKHTASYLQRYIFSTAEQKRAREKYDTFNREVARETGVLTEKLVLDSLSDLDGQLTPFMRQAILNAVDRELERAIDTDEAQQSSELQVLWRRAVDGGFMTEHKQPILSARLSRARQLVPGIRNRIVEEALGHRVFGTEGQRRAEERYRTFNREVSEEAYSRLQRIVFDGINDPDRKLTLFTRRAIATCTLAELDRRLGEDRELASTLQSLWNLAHDGGYGTEHREAILNTHVSRAKHLIPGILNRIVAEALGNNVDAGTGPHPIDWNLARDAAFVNVRKH